MRGAPIPPVPVNPQHPPDIGAEHHCEKFLTLQQSGVPLVMREFLPEHLAVEADILLRDEPDEDDHEEEEDRKKDNDEEDEDDEDDGDDGYSE